MMVHAAIHDRPPGNVVQALMRQHPAHWAVVVRFPEPSVQWHVWAGNRVPLRRAIVPTWRWFFGFAGRAEQRISGALVGPVESASPVAATTARGVQLALLPQLVPTCRTCNKAMTPASGQPGRPRSHCFSCRPSTWPRRGERWHYDGRPVVVLGSTKRGGAHVRVRPEDSSFTLVVPGALWSADAVRLPVQSLEAS
jgi:hypothetical protein